MTEPQKQHLISNDIILLQETRMGDGEIRRIPGISFNEHTLIEVDYPLEEGSTKGKGSNGVATLVRNNLFSKGPSIINTRLPGWDRASMEGRYLEIHFGRLVIINAYFPHASRGRDERIPYKNRFNESVLQRVCQLKLVGASIIMGADVNVAQEKIDLHPQCVSKITSGFRDVERNWLRKLTEELVDVYRRIHPSRVSYTTWFYPKRTRNLGFRYDVLLITKDILPRLVDHHSSWTASDHIPVSAVLEVPEVEEDGDSVLEDKSFNKSSKLNRQSSQSTGELQILRSNLAESASVWNSTADWDLPTFFEQNEAPTLPPAVETLRGSPPPDVGTDSEKAATLNYRLLTNEERKAVANNTAEFNLNDGEEVDGVMESPLSHLCNTYAGLMASLKRYGEGESISDEAMAGLQWAHQVWLLEESDAKLEANVFTKSKRVADKVRPVATNHPSGSEADPYYKDFAEDLQPAATKRHLNEEQLDAIFSHSKSFDNFLTDSEYAYLREEIKGYRDAFSFNLKERG
ncbi:hypothetical protein HDV05_007696, partial [Chytridiales sp. JEL 0842]